ncbi:MAG: septum formation initiator family protein [Actinomycetota bacterium]
MTALPRPLRLGLHGSLLAATMLVLAMMAVTPARLLLGQHERIATEQQRLDKLTRENRELERRLSRLDDPAYLETQARQRLGMARPGETVYLIPEDPPRPAAAPRPAPDPLHLRVLRWFSEGTARVLSGGRRG